MNLKFYKYQGTGNDFVMLDNLDGGYDNLSLSDIQFLCDRKMGIGADGLIKLNAAPNVDFEVDYYNADGSKSFCGNGARCSIAFARHLGIIENRAKFLAIDGMHQGTIEKETVRLEMLPVKGIESIAHDYFVHTGSPHYVHLKKEGDADIVTYGKLIRYSDLFKEQGVNVNYFNELSSNKIAVETYERGVEDETLSCGTGVTGCALVYMEVNELNEGEIEVETKGGKLSVSATRKADGSFCDIWLSGPATCVFTGEIEDFSNV